MNLISNPDRLLLARSSVLAREWKLECFRMFTNETRRLTYVKKLTIEEWNILSSTYYLETINFSSNYKGSLSLLVDKLQVATGIENKRKIKSILETYGPGAVSNSPGLEDRVSEELALSNEELMYGIVKDAFELDHDIIPLEYVTVNWLKTVREGYSVYPGGNGIINKRRVDLDASKDLVYSGILPRSVMYIKWIMNILKKSMYVMFTTLTEEEIRKILGGSVKVHTVLSITLVINGNINIDGVLTRVKSMMPEFPFRKLYMPPFETMFKSLVESNENSKIEWSVPISNFNLGIVQKIYPLDYETTSSLTDHFAEGARIVCKEGPFRMGSQLVTPISPQDAWIKLMLSPRRREILAMDTYHRREEVWNVSKGCSLFNTSYASYVYSRFGGSQGRVLDFSSGWGDRLIGAHVAGVEEYVHFDPNPDLGEVYEEIDKACSKLTGRKLTRTYYPSPFERNTKLFKKGGEYYRYFNMAFTSPPFYDKELYTGTNTSTSLYKTYEEWLEKFYVPSVTAAWNSLVAGGWLALYLPHSDNNESVVNMMYESARKVVRMHKKDVDTFEFCLGYVQLTEGRGAARKTFMWRKM